MPLRRAPAPEQAEVVAVERHAPFQHRRRCKSVRDVADRSLVETRLRESEARFRGVWENTRDAMALTNPEGIVLAINPAHTDLYGFSSDALVGRHFFIIYPEAERAAIAATNRALFADPGLPPTFESTIQREDGSVREAALDAVAR